MAASGYRVVDIYSAEVEPGDRDFFILHVERVERHDVDSLDTRNRELQASAVAHGLDTYDGMDVGPPSAEH